MSGDVVILSAFRNAAAYTGRYFAQVADLQAALQHRGGRLRLILGYGDSSDGTDALLPRLSAGFDADLVDCAHGGPVYGNVVDPRRFEQLAYLGNRLWSRIPETAKAVLWVESDLVWHWAVALEMIGHLASVAAVAPIVCDGPDSWYDTWAFRYRGEEFRKAKPWHPAIWRDGPGFPRIVAPEEDRCGSLVRLTSAGSFLALRGPLARQLSVPKEDVIVGLCRQITGMGESIWLDPTVAVFHP